MPPEIELGNRSLLRPTPSDYCILPRNEKPRLVVVVDTEEEFDWHAEFSRTNTSVQALRYIHRIQKILDDYKIVPVYAVDYPVVSQKDGYQPLAEIHAEGRCVIGTHLHPWVNPPFRESVNRRNSFPGNLPRALEAEKLHVLGDLIGERFGQRPVIYKAGRYGIGLHTAAILEAQGYEVDLSVCPHMDYSAEGGPDFSSNTGWPYWFGKGRLLELPLTVGFAGLLRKWGSAVHRAAMCQPMLWLHAPGILARSRLVNKIWLSPEGHAAEELEALVRALYRQGLRVFSFAFHSPSLEPGRTPYVKSQRELDEFLARCRRFFDFFMGEIGGIPKTPMEVKARLGARV